MDNRFKVEILEGALDFFDEIEKKAVSKIIFNIRKSQQIIDNEVFKKLDGDI